MRRLATILLPAALVAAPLALAAPPAHPPANAHAKASAKAVQVDSATLHTFAHAYEAAMKVRSKYMVSLRHANNNAQMEQSIQRKAMKAMKKRVSQIMPFAQFQKIGMAIRVHPALRKRLRAIVMADRRAASQK